MLYIDYTWDLESNRILLDNELNIDRLGWRNGDYFQVKNVNGRAMLVKVDPLTKFLKDGENNGKNNPYWMLPRQIWTDRDSAKFTFIAFIVGIAAGVVACI
jgi:hypothetical protein